MGSSSGCSGVCVVYGYSATCRNTEARSLSASAISLASPLMLTKGSDSSSAGVKLLASFHTTFVPFACRVWTLRPYAHLPMLKRAISGRCDVGSSVGSVGAWFPSEVGIPNVPGTGVSARGTVGRVAAFVPFGWS
eukprot:scaffold16896_cov78-Phaeocystis_antarctica.AAC.1